MKNIFKNMLVFILMASLACGTAFAFSACSDNNQDEDEENDSEQDITVDGDDNTDGSENTDDVNTDGDAVEYYFDAEYTDLTDLTGDLGSGTAFGREMITSGERAHEGYYVDNFNVVGSTITFTIVSDKAATVSMSLFLSALSESSVDSELLIIKVNNTTIDYDAITVTSKTEQVSAIKSVIIFEEYAIGDIQLVKGENIITFTEGEKANASGSGTFKVSLRFDAMKLTSSDAVLSWDPIEASEWDEFYPAF